MFQPPGGFFISLLCGPLVTILPKYPFSLFVLCCLRPVPSPGCCLCLFCVTVCSIRFPYALWSYPPYVLALLRVLSTPSVSFRYKCFRYILWSWWLLDLLSRYVRCPFFPSRQMCSADVLHGS